MKGVSVQIKGSSDRLGKLIERQDDRDFPFYNGKPVGFSGKQWGLIVLSVVVAFAILLVNPADNNIQSLIPRVLFTAIPLLTLAYIAKDKWKALFFKPTRSDIKNIFGFLALNILVSAIAAVIVKALFTTADNPFTETLKNAGVFEYIAFYLGTGIQLMGEELFTILPFLAIMYFLYTKKKVSRKTSIIAAWIITALVFGAGHLETYDWNIVQALLVIGSARIVLTLAYIRTKNLWVSYGTHLLNDWIIFTAVTLGASLQ